MAEVWPQVARLDAAGLVAAVAERSELRPRLVRALPGGQVGAALVRLATGELAVLSSWPGEVGARAPEVARIVARLRAGGYPAPAYLATVDCGSTTAVLQELVEGAPPGEVGVALVQALLDLNHDQRGAMEVAAGSVAQLHLERDGPGYCLHEPLRRHGHGTAALLDRIHDVARSLPPDAVTGADAVHGDFHPGNVLVRPGSTDLVAGVVDWTGAHVGDSGLDLITLGFAVDHATGGPAATSATRELVRERITSEVGPAALMAFTAHMALRQVDWAIRHHGPAQAGRWTDIAEDWLTWASRSTR